MPATIDEIKQLLEFRANKNGYNAYISPDKFNLVWNRAEKRYFKKIYPSNNANQNISEALSVFKTDPIPVVVDENGKYSKPADIIRIDSIRSTFSSIEVYVERVEDNRLSSHLTSLYDAPTGQFPIYVEYKDYLQFYPITLGAAKLVYYQEPTPSKWGYTIVSQRPVYNPETSVQPKWDDMAIEEIMYLAGDDLGINLRDQELQAFNQRKEQQGSI